MPKRRHVPCRIRALRQRCGDGVAGRVVGPVALRDGPLHHSADALAELPRRGVTACHKGSRTDMMSAVVT